MVIFQVMYRTYNENYQNYLFCNISELEVMHLPSSAKLSYFSAIAISTSFGFADDGQVHYY